MFTTAAQVLLLEQRLAFSEREREKLEYKVGELEKEVKSERKRFDRTQAVVMDYTMHKTQGIGKVEKIQGDLPLKAEEVEHKFTPTEESTIEALARNMMAADADAGNTPYKLDAYISAIKADPGKYNAILVN